MLGKNSFAEISYGKIRLVGRGRSWLFIPLSLRLCSCIPGHRSVV